jgi:hypothetical protein
MVRFVMCNNSERNVYLNPKISTQTVPNFTQNTVKYSPKTRRTLLAQREQLKKNQRNKPTTSTGSKNQEEQNLQKPESSEKTTIHPWKQAHGGTKTTLALKTKGSHEHPERKARNLPLRAKQRSPEGLSLCWGVGGERISLFVFLNNLNFWGRLKVINTNVKNIILAFKLDR